MTSREDDERMACLLQDFLREEDEKAAFEVERNRFAPCHNSFEASSLSRIQYHPAPQDVVPALPSLDANLEFDSLVSDLNSDAYPYPGPHLEPYRDGYSKYVLDPPIENHGHWLDEGKGKTRESNTYSGWCSEQDKDQAVSVGYTADGTTRNSHRNKARDQNSSFKSSKTEHQYQPTSNPIATSIPKTITTPPSNQSRSKRKPKMKWTRERIDELIRVQPREVEMPDVNFVDVSQPDGSVVTIGVRNRDENGVAGFAMRCGDREWFWERAM